ncbi:MAG: tetratricopeptide repeat protein, partial [Candidatus Omnitrophica bacterium]|nr:tetratricopeptide repeat protein [Candidatus Omnitrophota bacterium]
MNKLVCVLLTYMLFVLPITGYSLSLNDAQKDYLYGNYEEAISKTERLNETPDVLYFLGLAHIKIGNYSIAREYLRKIIKKDSRSKFYGQALVKLADTYFLQEKLDKAYQLFSEIKLCSMNLSNMPVVILRLAQISSRQGNFKNKRKYIKLLKEQYPQSAEIKYADILENYGDFFTVQVGAFIEKRNALALVKEFQDSYDIYIDESQNIFKVRVGKYFKRSEAQKVTLEFLDKGYPARIYP